MSNAPAPGKNKLPLHWKMFIGFGLGLVLGLVVHLTSGADADWVKAFTAYVTTPFSKVFLSLIFMLIVPLLFSALVVGIAEMGDIRALGRIGWKTLGYTVVLSSIAVLIGLLLVNWLKPGAGVDPALAQTLITENAERAKEIVASVDTQPRGMDMLLSIVPDNVISAASSNGSILAVMFFALMLGIGLVLTRTPAVPMPPRMHTSITMTCCQRVRSTPKNWARNNTVTPSNSAVPFWLAVAPTVSTKREIRLGRRSSSSATRSAVGRVALLDAVENAIRLASCVSRKNAIGDLPTIFRASE